jgi:lysozyme family protein
MMDYGVNSGPRAAIRALQRVVNTTADGKFGPETMAAVERLVERRGALHLAEALVYERAQRLTRIGCRRRGSEVFLAGWMKRIADNLMEVRSLKEA